MADKQHPSNSAHLLSLHDWATRSNDKCFEELMSAERCAFFCRADEPPTHANTQLVLEQPSNDWKPLGFHERHRFHDARQYSIMFSFIKQSIKPAFCKTKAEDTPRIVSIQGMRGDMFKNLFMVGRAKDPAEDFVVVGSNPDPFVVVDRQAYIDFFTVGGEFTGVASPLCDQWIDVE
ncbi:hypothetical protein BCR42DRAFT_397794 [Absidia repens]|uniref:Uncharacterized protein n=1 Tax=Absidia repens TaxID=90262 RepID=A0A1X2I085_9FUNG|nr:hypothetical protein BCR42DRAFT_397794 [Absidia repens]